MIELNLIIWIIVLNSDNLSIPNKRQGLLDWLLKHRQDSSICCLLKTHFELCSPRGLRCLFAVAVTARGTPSRFLASVQHSGLGRYVQQLQRLSFSVSRDGPSSCGAREFVEREVIDFARRNPGVVIHVHSRPCCVPRVVAEYLNGAVREESIRGKSVEEISTLVQKRANQSGLDVIRIRKPFHTDNPSIQGQWHPFTNKSTTFHGLRPGEVQDPASAQLQAQ
uniref:39S ribosomal protein L43, mitochondrial-like n=1 Tax=Callithrix jacchus TaxID=9483 RepID=UPI000D1972E3|nr:39S ribosomal protein L43, mitochondrial-like [Callithrix jacchus]